MSLEQNGTECSARHFALSRHRFALVLATWSTCVCLGAQALGQGFVPFVIPARIDSAHAIWMADAPPIRVDSERPVVRDAHFYRGDKRVRIWGVNLSFGANFPTHEDARHVAGRLAAAGVNSVRCHHMDTARWPRGLWDAATGKTIEPEALDRLDYFINELAQRGILVNINLHVGREHSQYVGLPEPNRKYDKISGIFTPELIDAQKQFARDLLDHVNTYRNVRYADDPAVAFVEITNEDSFFMWDSEETLRTLPKYYASILRDQFNIWLERRHGSGEALRRAWSKGTQPLGDNLIENGKFDQRQRGENVPRKWNLEKHDGCQARLSLENRKGRDGVKVEIDRADGTNWHLQFTQGGFSIRAGTYYTLAFDAVALESRPLQCSVGQAHDPWSNLGLSRSVELTNEWQTFQFGFVGKTDDNNARISFAFGGDDRAFYLANVKLRPGGQVALAEGESLDKSNVGLFAANESRARILDRMTFLAETEKAYFDGMRSYIKNDLGCDALVTGTIVFGPLGLYAQSDMDFIDTHAYWQHPRFPGRPWDAGNWTIEQRPMTDHIEEATLFRLAAERLAGKPFTCSEYNHPAPMDAQAECVPMIASFAAAQDWDGVWLYTYSHSSDGWGREHLNSYFDIDTNPAKWGFMRAGTAIFREWKVGPIRRTAGARFARADGLLANLAGLHQQYDRDMLGMLSQVSSRGISRQSMLECIYLPSFGFEVPHAFSTAHHPTEIEWSVDAEGRGFYEVTARNAQAYQAHVCIGHAGHFAGATDGQVRIQSPGFVALTVTPLDSGRTILVTACGRVENTGMEFSEDRRTVGRNWGQAPVRIEPVTGTVTLPPGQWICHALAPDGSKKMQVPIGQQNGQPILGLSREYATMWYLVEGDPGVMSY